jgi:hypothetical protein
MLCVGTHHVTATYVLVVEMELAEMARVIVIVRLIALRMMIPKHCEIREQENLFI